jgi:hypothetical protein
MTPHAVPPPEHRTAEGLCDGIPYDTDLVSINGVAIHFWYGDRTPTPEEVQPVLATARRHRDIVGCTFSAGAPTKFWAHEDIGRPPYSPPFPYTEGRSESLTP